MKVTEDSSQPNPASTEYEPNEGTTPPSGKPPIEETPPRAPSAADYLGLSDADIDIDSLVK